MQPDERRSRTMRAVRSKNTSPEMTVRRLLHAMGYRYRLHKKQLPGTPDIVFASRRKVIFVNGCFWHGHDCPRGKRVPKTNSKYWLSKIEGNKKRDKRNYDALTQQGWNVLIIWECQIKDQAFLSQALSRFLEHTSDIAQS